MKLIRASIHNFRLLKNIDIDFCNDGKCFTVIRAENESGKTTLLNALQWGLFGEAGLPSKQYRLHHLEVEDTGESERLEICVSIDFELSSMLNEKEKISTFHLERTAIETVQGNNWKRRPPNVKLFEVTDDGYEEIKSPESFILAELPQKVREVFFTDGDRALTFIEEGGNKNVEEAIRSLLGIDILINACEHTKYAWESFRRELTKTNKGNRRLEQLKVIEERCELTIAESDKTVEDGRARLVENELLIEKFDGNIKAMLSRGDRREYEKTVARLDSEIKRLKSAKENELNSIRNLLNSNELSRILVWGSVDKSVSYINELYDKKEIPNKIIPILKQLLKTDQCFCGECLKGDDEESKKRYDHIKQLINNSKDIDEIKSIINDLYYEKGHWVEISSGARAKFLQSLKEKQSNYFKIIDGLDSLQKEIRGYQEKIIELSGDNVEGITTHKNDLERDKSKILREIAQAEANKTSSEREKRAVLPEINQLERQDNKSLKVRAKIQAALDVKDVLKATTDRIKTDELDKTSMIMNQLFMKMIQADEESSNIVKANIKAADYSINVQGSGGKTLDTVTDLNGASRRALTMAFVLALTKVSEVTAPTIIDTPLGMMSGAVKKEVLRTLIDESKQLVLLLTRSEINDLENMILKEAGNIVTFTNLSHYPKFLVNEPDIKEKIVVRCNCQDLGSCNVCELKDYKA